MTATATPDTMIDAPSVTVAKADLARALRACASVRSQTVRLDLYGGHATVTGATPEVAVTVGLPGEQTGDGGSVIVPRKMLAGLLPFLGPEVQLAIGEEAPRKLVVGSARSLFEIRAVVDDDGLHSHGLEVIGVRPVKFDAPVLVEALRRAIPFAGTDPSRPMLESIALYPKSTIAAATDSYRLAVIRYGTEDDQPDEPPTLVHRDGARSLMSLLKGRLDEVTLTDAGHHLVAVCEELRWSITLPTRGSTREFAYPKWRTLLPDGFTTAVTLDRLELLAAARAAAVIATSNQPMRLLVTPTTVAVTVSSNDAGSMSRELATATVEGESHEIGVNPDFVADMAANTTEDRLTLRLIGPLRPIQVESGRDTHLLMPIRLNV